MLCTGCQALRQQSAHVEDRVRPHRSLPRRWRVGRDRDGAVGLIDVDWREVVGEELAYQFFRQIDAPFGGEFRDVEPELVALLRGLPVEFVLLAGVPLLTGAGRLTDLAFGPSEQPRNVGTVHDPKQYRQQSEEFGFRQLAERPEDERRRGACDQGGERGVAGQCRHREPD
jgi:hypothetical protein